MKPDLVAGSPLWQTIFFSCAALLLLLQVLRGWRLGLPRQLVRLGALLAAYSAALFGGRALLPFLRPLIKVPDFVIAALGGVILAMIAYSLINTVGAILFKSTAQQSSSAVRLVYGASGAALGLLFGLFFIWIIIVGVRSVGALAEAEVNAHAPNRIAAFEERALRTRQPARRSAIDVPSQDSLIFSLARLKKSIELGPIGAAVKQSDVLPSGIYETLGRLGEVFSKPDRVARFVAYPGVSELLNHPKILALRADPEITRRLEQGQLWDLIQDDRLIEAANDPALAAEVKKFDLKRALDYAAKAP